MQFGLDARNIENGDAMLLMFPAGNNSNPRKRIEAKSYRARDRCDNGWFSHDNGGSSNTTSGATPGKSHHVECCCRCGDKLTPAPVVTPRSSSRSEGRQNRDRVLGYDHPPEWYGFDQLTPKKNEFAVRHEHSKNVASLRKREFYPNSKDWYRHEHTMVCVDDDEVENSHGKAACFSSPSWWPLEKEDCRGSVEQSPRPRLLGPDAERYWQRDHSGSTKEWFSHDHAQEERKGQHWVTDVLVEDNDGGATEAGTKSTQRETDVFCSCCQDAALVAGDNSSKPYASVGGRTRQALTEKFLQAQ